MQQYILCPRKVHARKYSNNQIGKNFTITAQLPHIKESPSNIQTTKDTNLPSSSTTTKATTTTTATDHQQSGGGKRIDINRWWNAGEFVARQPHNWPHDVRAYDHFSIKRDSWIEFRVCVCLKDDQGSGRVWALESLWLGSVMCFWLVLWLCMVVVVSCFSVVLERQMKAVVGRIREVFFFHLIGFELVLSGSVGIWKFY